MFFLLILMASLPNAFCNIELPPEWSASASFALWSDRPVPHLGNGPPPAPPGDAPLLAFAAGFSAVDDANLPSWTGREAVCTPQPSPVRPIATDLNAIGNAEAERRRSLSAKRSARYRQKQRDLATQTQAEASEARAYAEEARAALAAAEAAARAANRSSDLFESRARFAESQNHLRGRELNASLSANLQKTIAQRDSLAERAAQAGRARCEAEAKVLECQRELEQVHAARHLSDRRAERAARVADANVTEALRSRAALNQQRRSCRELRQQLHRERQATAALRRHAKEKKDQAIDDDDGAGYNDDEWTPLQEWAFNNLTDVQGRAFEVYGHVTAGRVLFTFSCNFIRTFNTAMMLNKPSLASPPRTALSAASVEAPFFRFEARSRTTATNQGRRVHDWALADVDVRGQFVDFVSKTAHKSGGLSVKRLAKWVNSSLLPNVVRERESPFHWTTVCLWHRRSAVRVRSHRPAGR